MTTFDVTKRNKVLRLAKRARYDHDEVYAILDAAMLCHVGYEIDGQPYVMPTLVARDGDTLLLHGSSASRTIRHAGAGHPICVTVTHTDGIVLARSAFNHSINYRSAMLYGRGSLVTERDEKIDALFRFTEKLLPERWDDIRPMTDQELKATGVVAVPIDSASAKVRTGFPADELEDVDLPFWGGVIPMRQVLDDPVPDSHVPADMPVPGYLLDHVARHRTVRVEE
ncbi:MAG: pyridoxamine 5'-phosphate oxidase family protein [Chloroflexota bacterium]|nr:pyridoxamine 5'-phosphate oxidase family protein [Chloroflexia bacterium]MDQ3228082.1 pyridoxamine 5'-phosphate oxidase family protein [Chloroflexota bacterium]